MEGRTVRLIEAAIREIADCHDQPTLGSYIRTAACKQDGRGRYHPELNKVALRNACLYMGEMDQANVLLSDVVAHSIHSPKQVPLQGFRALPTLRNLVS